MLKTVRLERASEGPETEGGRRAARLALERTRQHDVSSKSPDQALKVLFMATVVGARRRQPSRVEITMAWLERCLDPKLAA